jgi:hypothetical protein
VLILLFDVVLRMHLSFSSEISFKKVEKLVFANFPNIRLYHPTSDFGYQNIAKRLDKEIQSKKHLHPKNKNA